MLSLARRFLSYPTTRMTENLLRQRVVAVELMKKRTVDKEKARDCNRADIQVVGVDGGDYFPSLIVSSAGRSHIFNCSEGTQRLCYSHKVKLKPVENVFITNLQWDHIAGIYGLTLTLQDQGLPNLTIYSSSNIQDYFEPTKNYLSIYTGMQLASKSYLEEHNDSGILIKPVLIDIVDSNDATTKKTKLTSPLAAYVCYLPSLPGALDPQKCRELNVPIGPKLAILKSGGSVELADGTIVTSSQVVAPPKPAIKFIVLECPSEKYIDTFINNTRLLEALDPLKDPRELDVEMLIHFSPQSVVQDERYQGWIRSMPSSCKHFFLPSPEYNLPNFVWPQRLQHILNSFDSCIFPPLYMPEYTKKIMINEREVNASQQEKDPNRSDGDDSDELELESKETIVPYNTLGQMIHLQNLDKLVFRPKSNLVRTEVPLAINHLLKIAECQPDYQKELDALRNLQSKLPNKSNDHEPELVFLGTGSALPSMLRNTSNILLNFYYPMRTSIMLDCGEDSYGQLCRFYGPEKLPEILKSLKLIYVSHQHADHHIGLIRLLNARKKLTKDRILLLLPPHIEKLLQFHNNNFDDLQSTYKIIGTNSISTKPALNFHSDAQIEELKQEIYKNLDGLVDEIIVVPVLHCYASCGVILRFNIGHKELDKFTLTYSGDARPSPDLVVAGKDCDLLIHEATFDANHGEDAIIKKHSTSSEAIAVAKAMKAKFTILTHFSQRLSKVPWFNEEFDETIGFAFDNLQLRCPSHFARLPILKPILSVAFRNSLQKVREKHEKDVMKAAVVDSLLQSHKGGELD